MRSICCFIMRSRLRRSRRRFTPLLIDVSDAGGYDRMDGGDGGACLAGGDSRLSATSIDPRQAAWLECGRRICDSAFFQRSDCRGFAWHSAGGREFLTCWARNPSRSESPVIPPSAGAGYWHRLWARSWPVAGTRCISSAISGLFVCRLVNPPIRFHQVGITDYGLFKYPDYTLPLSVKMAEVSRDFGLDVLHVHYAVPHATAAILAQSMLPADQRPRRGDDAPWHRYDAAGSGCGLWAGHSSCACNARMPSRPSRTICAAKRSACSPSTGRSK